MAMCRESSLSQPNEHQLYAKSHGPRSLPPLEYPSNLVFGYAVALFFMRLRRISKCIHILTWHLGGKPRGGGALTLCRYLQVCVHMRSSIVTCPRTL
jgi:hypothetical protein